MEATRSALSHSDRLLVTTSLGSRGLEKKVVIYVSPNNFGDFLAVVKEKNFIEVASRSISQVRAKNSVMTTYYGMRNLHLSRL